MKLANSEGAWVGTVTGLEGPVSSRFPKTAGVNKPTKVKQVKQSKHIPALMDLVIQPPVLLLPLSREISRLSHDSYLDYLHEMSDDEFIDVFTQKIKEFTALHTQRQSENCQKLLPTENYEFFDCAPSFKTSQLESIPEFDLYNCIEVAPHTIETTKETPVVKPKHTPLYCAEEVPHRMEVLVFKEWKADKVLHPLCAPSTLVEKTESSKIAKDEIVLIKNPAVNITDNETVEQEPTDNVSTSTDWPDVETIIIGGEGATRAKTSAKGRALSIASNTTTTDSVITTDSADDIIIRRATWYNRLIFRKSQSKFRMSEHTNLEIGQLTKRKQQKFRDTLTVRPDYIDTQLYSFLRMQKFPKYENRQMILDHMSKLSCKYWQDIRKIPFSKLTGEQVNINLATVQKATDERANEFLLAPEDQEIDRRRRLVSLTKWLESHTPFGRSNRNSFH